MYTDKTTDHFNNPRNVGEAENFNAEGVAGNAKCGDIMKMTMRIENDTIEDIKFKTFGCGAAIATSSMATVMLKGKTIEEALTITNKDIVEALEGLPPEKIHCSVLAEEAVRAAIEDYRNKKG